jgi:hypothetical protein
MVLIAISMAAAASGWMANLLRSTPIRAPFKASLRRWAW